MFIQHLHIDRFGAVANSDLRNLTDGVTVIYGAPGAGKTTLQQFARTLLYGFNDSVRSRYVPANRSAEYGGSLTWMEGRHQYTIRRHDLGHFDGQVELLEDGQPADWHTLTDHLQGVSEDLYTRLFAVDYSRRPDVGRLLEEAERSGLGVTGEPIDTAKLQELQSRRRTLEATLATLEKLDQSAESLRARRHELLDEIARLELDAAQRLGERTQIQEQVDTTQAKLDSSREELQALRKALDELATTRRECRAKLAKAESDAANNRTHEAEVRELSAQIERWKVVLREAAQRYETLGKLQPTAVQTEVATESFESQLAALDSYLRELEQATAPVHVGVQTWDRVDNSNTMRELRERLLRLRSQLDQQRRPAVDSCECERKQLTRTQAELQMSLRHLEEERDGLAARSRLTPQMTDEIEGIRTTLADLDAKEKELRQRFDAVTLAIRQLEIDLTAYQHRLHALASELAERLARQQEELQHVERQLADHERRQTLIESLTETERQIRLLGDGGGDSSTLRAATSYLRRISENEFQRIEVASGKHVWVTDTKGHRLSWGHLSEGARDKVYLALSLALVESHQRHRGDVPVIWKDVFTNFDSRQVPQSAELLRHFAREGRQLLLLTRHEHVASVFRAANLPARYLTSGQNWHVAAPAQATRRAPQDVNHLLNMAGDAETDQFDPAWDLATQHRSNGEHFLYECNPIEQAPSLSSDNIVRLRRLGITTVGDLLRTGADELAARLSYAGISSKMVSVWQAQARLMCRVARLREYDARILVACGITDSDQLRQIPPTEVRMMIERFAESAEGRSMLLSGTEFELSRVTDWVQTEDDEGDPQQAGSPQPAARHYETSGHRETGHAPFYGSRESRHHHPVSGRSESRTPTARSGRPSDGSDPSPQHATKPAATIHDSATDADDDAPADVVQMNSSTKKRKGLRFFLDSDAGVVDAPSIGPRSAERLEGVGVVTVSDFLAADAEEVAGRLKNKRMSAKMLREWQQQTELVCRVPQLRGHDAQILVAVGITEVSQLAAMDPQQLWARVEPFVESSAGKRIIRSSKAPDFEEVFNWIDWANQARPLKVA